MPPTSAPGGPATSAPVPAPTATPVQVCAWAALPMAASAVTATAIVNLPRMVVLMRPLKFRRDQVWGIPGGNAAYRCQRDGARFTNRRRCRPMTNHQARDRLEQALDRIADPKGAGARACLTVYPERSRT